MASYIYLHASPLHANSVRNVFTRLLVFTFIFIFYLFIAPKNNQGRNHCFLCLCQSRYDMNMRTFPCDFDSMIRLKRKINKFIKMFLICMLKYVFTQFPSIRDQGFKCEPCYLVQKHYHARLLPAWLCTRM